jgi:tripartite-type tricarboxylate transporter receptor subunit TctC
MTVLGFAHDRAARTPWRRRSVLLLSLLAMLPGVVGASAVAADYPSRPIKIVVPYAPGGITDTVARLVGEQLAPALGQNVIVENKPGANSIIGADAVAKSPADGYTLAMVIGAHAANATLYAGKLPFDPVADFAPVSLVGTTPLVMVTSTKLPVRTLRELIDYAKSHPGAVNYGSSGVGAAAHLTTEDLARRTGIELVHVPYRGSALAMADLIAGHIGAMFDTLLLLKPQIDAGSIRGIAVASDKRSAYAPDIPTFAEAGVPDFISSTWTLLLAPANTPRPIVDRLSSEVAKALGGKAFRDKLLELGVDPVGNTPGEAAEFLKAEVTKWGAVIRAIHLKLD